MSFRYGFVDGYLDPVQVRDIFFGLPEQFPELCRLENLPHETHGYWGARQDLHGRQRMSVLHVTSPHGSDPGAKPAVLLMRSPHAREWINGIAVTETALQLLENYRPDDPDERVRETVRLLDQVVFMIVPESNPDGALSSFFDQGRRMWRKNLRPPPAPNGCPGVDCNRNFPNYWGEAGSSSSSCTEIFCGPSPLSEPESANIAELVSRHLNILFAIDSHSSGQAIFRPNVNGGTYVPHLPVSPEDEAIYVNLERAMNRQIRMVKGTEYATGSTSNHAGTSDEYLFFSHRVFGFDLECGTEFQPPVADALLAAREVAQAVRGLGLCASGETGLDISALLARRQSYDFPTDIAVQIVAAPVATPLEPLAPEAWRRFIVRLTPRRPEAVTAEMLALMEEGFDVEEDLREGAISVIASARDLETLLRRNYRPTIVADAEALGR